MADGYSRRNRRERKLARQHAADEALLARELAGGGRLTGYRREGGAEAREVSNGCTAPVNEVTYPHFDDDGSCRVNFSEHVVGADEDGLMQRLVAVPLRSRTIARRASAYRPSTEEERFRRDAAEATSFPARWDADAVLEWFARGIAVMASLPSTHLYPARLRAVALPVVREAIEAYGYERARARWTADSKDIALMEATLAWPSLISKVKVRKAFMMYAMGLPSAQISRILGYKSRAWGKKLALDGAGELAVALNGRG